jgi:hypothetical protein
LRHLVKLPAGGIVCPVQELLAEPLCPKLDKVARIHESSQKCRPVPPNLPMLNAFRNDAVVGANYVGIYRDKSKYVEIFRYCPEKKQRPRWRERGRWGFVYRRAGARRPVFETDQTNFLKP